MRNPWTASTIKSKGLAALGLLAAVGIAAAFNMRGGEQARYLTAKVDRGDIRDEVEATGVVTAVVTVQVGSQVSGTIAKLNADFNSRVHRGDVVALIDPALFDGALQQAKADLQTAKANVVAVETTLEKAQATLIQTQADYNRQAALARSGAQSQQVVEVAKANFDVAKSSVAAARAAIEQATNLAYTTIRSPIDGIVIARNVDVGQTVAASLQAPTIFNIAQDLTKMQLYAKTDESDVGRIKVGQPVTFKVDAFPKDVFRGMVSQKRMNATTVQNVVTYDTIIDFDNNDMRLFPGMTAYVTIPVAVAEKALKLPNTALRYRPSVSAAELRALYAKYSIGDSPEAVPEGAKTPPGEHAVVWKLAADKTLEPAEIAIGITDHAYTEVISVLHGQLTSGDNVITASVESRTQGAR